MRTYKQSPVLNAGIRITDKLDIDIMYSSQDNGSLDSSPTGAGKGRSRSAPCKKIKKQKVTTPVGISFFDILILYKINMVSNTIYTSTPLISE